MQDAAKLVFDAAMCIIGNGSYEFAYSWSNVLWSEPKSSCILRGRAKCGTGEVWQSFSMHSTEVVYGYFFLWYCELALGYHCYYCYNRDAEL